MDHLVAEKELSLKKPESVTYSKLSWSLKISMLLRFSLPHSEESRGNDDVYEGEGGGYVWLAASVQPAKQK